MTSYYNENDPFAAQWLRNLIDEKLIPEGDVDDRSIELVQPGDLRGYQQCHFFAGIAGWPLALRLAEWPETREVWTGSPPCQNFSVAGHVWDVRDGISGERGSLARTWTALVGAVQPAIVFFENVPGVSAWLAEITGCLEAAGYDVFEQKLSAASVGAPHLRRRVWLVADRNGTRLQESRTSESPEAPGEPWRTVAGDIWSAAPGRGGRVDDGVPNRVAAVRAYGNAIVPQVAAEFVRAFREAAE